MSNASGFRHQGLTEAEVRASRERHGSNRITPPPRPPWWDLYLEKFEDPIIRVLLVAAGLSIVVGWYKGEYLEGAAIVVTIFLATFLGFLNEYKAGREFDLLVQTRDDLPVRVVRDWAVAAIPRGDLVVDDLVLLATGDEIPADGWLLEGVALSIDESKLTGESFPVEKRPAEGGSTPGDTTDRATAPISSESNTYAADRLLRGTMVVEGHGLMRLSAVGDRTEMGHAARGAVEEREDVTPLNRQLERLSHAISLVGGTTALAIFAVLIGFTLWRSEVTLSTAEAVFPVIAGLGMVIAFVRLWLPFLWDGLEFLGCEIRSEGLFPERGHGWARWLVRGAVVSGILLALGILTGFLPPEPRQWLSLGLARELLHDLMVVVAIIVVAVPEGLTMSVTLCLAYGMRRMMADNNLVRRLHACETVGAATVICSDKTGTLTMNKMRVEAAFFAGFAAPQDMASLRPRNTGQANTTQTGSSSASTAEPAPGSPPTGAPISASTSGPANRSEIGFTGEIRRLVSLSIAVNSTAHLGEARSAGGSQTRGGLQPIGNPTEGALLVWLTGFGIEYQDLRREFAVGRQWPFSAETKRMATWGHRSEAEPPILLVKGAPEAILSRCTRLLSSDGIGPIGDQRGELESLMQHLQERGMRTLGFAYREDGLEPSVMAHCEDPATDLVWLGWVAIHDPERPEVRGALDLCQKAGVKVKMVTGDHPRTALEISRRIGLLTGAEAVPTGAVLDGPTFRALDDKAAGAAARDLIVLARATPSDKWRLVDLLKKGGEIVAVTGDGSNDAPALNRADVGLAMGKTGTDLAREASDIILLDDSFPSIINAIRWGRSLYVNIQRFLVFQLTVNLMALGITLLGPLLGVKLPLTVIQMLWVNLIMDTFAALALATEPPDPDIMERPPRNPESFIVTPEMQRSIFGFGGIALIGFLLMLVWFSRQGPVGDRELTLFFTTFVLIQFWNLFNVRGFGTRRFGLLGLGENPWFLLVAAVILGGQIAIVQFGGAVFRTVPLGMGDWFTLAISTAPVLVFGLGRNLLQERRSSGS